AQIDNQGANVLFVPVRGVIPDHALPVESAAVRCHAAADGARDLAVAPSTDAGLAVRGDVAGPERPERRPADLRPARAVVAVAQGARRDGIEITAARRQDGSLG